MARLQSCWKYISLLVFSHALAQACSCGSIPEKPGACHREWSEGEAIFFGRVTSISKTNDTGYLMSREVRFQVSDSFRGPAVPGQEFAIFTGMGGGDCGYPFVVGTSYLVYASQVNGRLTTAICSPTKPEVMAKAIVKELRAPRPDDLAGIVGMAPPGNGYEDLPESKPLPGIRVDAIGPKTFSTTTDQDGVYQFETLPQGEYRLEPQLPPGVIRMGPPKSVVVGTGCATALWAYPDGQVSGRVVDKDGNGVPGFITIERGLEGVDTPDGTFTLHRIFPGRHRLVFRPKINYRKLYYWPTEGFDIALGQHIENVHFEITLPTP